MGFPYRAVFAQAEASLLSYGTRHRPRSEILAQLAPFKAIPRSFSDDEYFDKLTAVVFYSGFRAATVTERMGVIRAHFPGWKTVAAYRPDDEARILNDPRMIRNQRKIRAVLKNAKAFASIIGEFRSFQEYVDSFHPDDAFRNVLALKRDLEARLSYLGGITAYHFLTDTGQPVLKPDRVICRLFHRLGLINDETDIHETVRQGRLFADETGEPIRYIDIIFVIYGQVHSPEFGIDKGICLNTPRCNECGLTNHCDYYKRRNNA